jgi:hypothetical protein
VFYRTRGGRFFWGRMPGMYRVLVCAVLLFICCLDLILNFAKVKLRMIQLVSIVPGVCDGLGRPG